MHLHLQLALMAVSAVSWLFIVIWLCLIAKHAAEDGLAEAWEYMTWKMPPKSVKRCLRVTCIFMTLSVPSWALLELIHLTWFVC